MTNTLRRVVAVAFFALFASCAGQRFQEGHGPDRGVITQDQLRENHFNNVYEAVEALRNNWLRTKSTDSFYTPSQLWAYLDETKLGGVETLKALAIGPVVYIKYLDGPTASARWGVDHSQGVILVSTRP